MAKHENLTIRPDRRPRVLLLGNGLNRVYGGASWAGLLDKLNRTGYTPDQVKGIPMPMQAVLLSEDHVDVSLKDLRRELRRPPWHRGARQEPSCHYFRKQSSWRPLRK